MIMIYIIIHALTYWYAMKCIEKIITQDKARDFKYSPFSRTDKLSYYWCKLPFVMTFWPRFFAIAIIITIYTIWVRACMIGHKMGTPMA